MVALVGAFAAVAGLAGCGQKGSLYLAGEQDAAARPLRASSSPMGIEGTDPLSSPATDVIVPPVYFPASRTPTP